MTEEEKRRAYHKAYYVAHKEDRLECYCSHIENIENYELAKADDFVNWDIHHRLETHTSDGTRRSVDLSSKELVALGTYYDRPASELIFLKHGDHTSLHNNGKHFSDETRAKLREAAKHRAPMSAETIAKMREAAKHRAPMSEATKAKMSTSRRGKHPSDETRAKMRAANLGKHHSEETRAKISASVKLHWSKTSAKNN